MREFRPVKYPAVEEQSKSKRIAHGYDVSGCRFHTAIASLVGPPEIVRLGCLPKPIASRKESGKPNGWQYDAYDACFTVRSIRCVRPLRRWTIASDFVKLA